MRLLIGLIFLTSVTLTPLVSHSQSSHVDRGAPPNAVAGVGSDIELNAFGRYLEPGRLDDIQFDFGKRISLQAALFVYSRNQQSDQVLRLCRVQEVLAANEKDRSNAHRCKVSALARLGRFTEVEELLFSPPPHSGQPDLSNPLSEISDLQIVGALALNQGDITAASQAYNSILSIIERADRQAIMRARGVDKEPDNIDGSRELQELLETLAQESRIDALYRLTRIEYFRQNAKQYFEKVGQLMKVLATFEEPNTAAVMTVDLALSAFRMGNKRLAVQLAQRAHAAIKADVGFRDQIEPLSDLSVPDVISRAVGDERTSRLHVLGRLRLARIYLFLERTDEARRILASTLKLAEHYILEEPASNTLIAEVEEVEADVMSWLGNHAAAISLLRSARQRRQLATDSERSSALGRRHLEVDSPLLAASARLLKEMALSTSMPITDQETMNLIFAILSDFSSSRADRSLKHASRVALEQNKELRALLERDGLLSDKLMDLRSILSAQVEHAKSISSSEIDDTRKRLRETLTELRTLKKSISSSIGPTAIRPITSHSQDLNLRLESNEIFWQWILHPEGNIVIKVTREGIYIRPVGASAENVTGWIDDVRKSASLDSVETASQIKQYPILSAHELFLALFPKVSMADLRRNHWILTAPHPLENIPWAALVTQRQSDGTQGARWLIEDVAVTLSPSIETWEWLLKRPSSNGRQDFLGIGDPENDEVISTAQLALKGSRVGPIIPPAVRSRTNRSFTSELLAVSDIFPATRRTVLAGTSATKTNLLAQPIHEYRAILFSTHGYLAGDVYKAMGPALLLSAPADKPDARFLLTSDVVSLRLTADVVVLSACDTSGSDGSPEAEGFSGLTSAFLLAGAKSVVATLWPVEREATSSLVQHAMRAYKANPNRPFSFSLQQAALAVMRGAVSQWHHPAFWSPFVVVGR